MKCLGMEKYHLKPDIISYNSVSLAFTRKKRDDSLKKAESLLELMEGNDIDVKPDMCKGLFYPWKSDVRTELAKKNPTTSHRIFLFIRGVKVENQELLIMLKKH